MKILIASTDMKAGSMPLVKGQRYVASDNNAFSVAHAAPGVIRIVSDATVYSRPWRGEDLTNKTLLVYRSLGIGDEFLAARLCEVAKRRFNAAAVKFACYESHHSLWAHCSTPFQLLPSVVSWEEWERADYHVTGERWWESIATTDQPDCFGVMGAVCGIKFFADEQRPYIPAPPEEVYAKTAAHLDERLAGRPVVLWQAAATSRIRSYPPEQTAKAMERILAETDAAIIVAGHPAQIAAYEIPDVERVATYSAGIPGLIALTAVVAARKGCVVCPDSVLGHIAAAYPALPVVSLWSSFDPSRRVASYPNHKPIFNPIKCGPCWSHEQHGDPAKYAGCPLTACNDYCAGMRTIDPATVAGAVVAVLKGQAA